MFDSLVIFEFFPNDFYSLHDWFMSKVLDFSFSYVRFDPAGRIIQFFEREASSSTRGFCRPCRFWGFQCVKEREYK